VAPGLGACSVLSRRFRHEIRIDGYEYALHIRPTDGAAVPMFAGASIR
jgi:hypothetical protein